MTDTSKTAKIIKRWYHSPSHRLTVNVLLSNITFLWFLLFSMCHSLHVAINKCINWCFVHLYLLFYYNKYNKYICFTRPWRHWTLNILGVTILIFRVTWRHRSRDHRTRRGHFPIGGQWWPCAYLARVQRYRALKILGSRVWLFGVMWRHRSRDHWTRHIWFPIGGPL